MEAVIITREMLTDWAEMAPSAFARAVDRLPMPTRRWNLPVLMRMRWGVADGQRKTLLDTAKALKITRERVRCLEVVATRLLAPLMREEVNR
jgi:ribosomal protein L28